jgi:predicted DNA-binding protein (UPF0251 family)
LEAVPRGTEDEEIVMMTVDEYETIRLIDLEDATQEDCCAQMHIARTTVQGIYAAARKKLADALVNGKKLVIRGGDYQLCGCYGADCGRGCKKQCRKYQCCCGQQTETADSD